MAASIARIGGEIAAAKRWVGPDLRLVVLPEYVLSGFPMGEPVERRRDMAALAPDGPEYAAPAGIAAAEGLHLSGNAYESDPNFPGLYFQASDGRSPSGPDGQSSPRRVRSIVV
jgi:predicted amidohydrolase